MKSLAIIIPVLALAACANSAITLEQQNCLAKQGIAGAANGGLGPDNPVTVQAQKDAMLACAGLYGIDPVTP